MSQLFHRFPWQIIFAICLPLQAQNLQIPDIKSPAINCDYLVICPETFLTQGLTLAAHRNSYPNDDVQNAKVATLKTIYEQFPLGDSIPQSFNIWYALQYATLHWAKKPRYVVLLGDDSIQVNGFDTLSKPPQSGGLMPTFFASADTSSYNSNDTVVDYYDYFYQAITDSTPPVNRNHNAWEAWSLGQTPPAFALGRIPAQTPEQCQAYIDKVVRFETQNKKSSWMNRMELIADDTHQGAFSDPLGLDHLYNAEKIARCAKGFFINKTYLSSFNKDFIGYHENAKKDFFNVVNAGTRWTVFFGHGHPDLLCDERFLQYSDYSHFKNDSTPMVMFTFSCSNAYFLRKPHLQMNKSFLFKPNGGCIAYFAATTEVYSQNNLNLAQAIFAQCDSSDSLSLGKAAQRAYASVRDENMVHFHLLGDPAITFQKKQNILSTAVSPGTGNDLIIKTTGPSTGASPFYYRYMISAQDSLQCQDDTAGYYNHDSSITESEGTFTGLITSSIPSSIRTKNVHYCLYVWNNETEARFDTLIAGLGPSRVLAGPRTNCVPPIFRFFPGALAISLPEAVSARAIKVSVMNLKGVLIKEIDLPCKANRALLQYTRSGIAPGNYFVKIVAEKRSFFSKICLVR
jgi:hypothetical protein